MTYKAAILIADDQRDVLSALKLLFKAEQYETVAVQSPPEVLTALAQSDFDLVLMDLNYRQDTTSGKEGLKLIEDIRALDSEIPLVVMTAWSSVTVAVEAMRRGAGDFVEKPWDNQRLLSIMRNQIALGRSLRRGRRLEAENALLRTPQPEAFIAQSDAMRPVLALIDRVAPSSANILITGEHGTGKSLLARLIHAHSDRAEKTMVTVNMGGLADSVFESEMFGHVKGAYTDAASDRVGRFELADNSTLFLDEIANIPLGQQSKLLRVLEEGEFERVGSSRTRRANVRVVSATNADLAQVISDGSFRQDLLFRLNTVEITVPPLRERREDILPMAEAFLAKATAKYRREAMRLSPTATQALGAHSWPGNVRELSHVVERAVLMAAQSEITVQDLRLAAVSTASSALEDMPLEAAERHLIESALARADGNVQDAAKALGLSRSALYRRLEKHGIRAGDASAE